jgi:RNA polymerase sigma-70 factor, ECF subfamily
MTRSEAQANDLVQETMLKALRSFDAMERVNDVRAWLLTIQRRAFIDRYRADQSRDDGLSLDSLDADSLAEQPGGEPEETEVRWSDPQSLLERFEDAQIIEALRSLPMNIRWTLMLVDVEQLDHAQAAEVLGVPVGTVKSRAHRGRAMLRQTLSQRAQAPGINPARG